MNINDKLNIVASCTCLTKTPEAKYHKPDCRYRIIMEETLSGGEKKSYPRSRRDEACSPPTHLREIAEKISFSAITCNYFGTTFIPLALHEQLTTEVLSAMQEWGQIQYNEGFCEFRKVRAQYVPDESLREIAEKCDEELHPCSSDPQRKVVRVEIILRAMQEAIDWYDSELQEKLEQYKYGYKKGLADGDDSYTLQ